MPTESEIKLARYNAIEFEKDKMGRTIGVRRLKPSEQTKVAGYCSELTGFDEVITPTGAKMLVPHRMPLLIAAAVCRIDEAIIPFARNRGELDSIFDRLDAEGIEAAGNAIMRLAEADPGAADPVAEAKN